MARRAGLLLVSVALLVVLVLVELLPVAGGIGRAAPSVAAAYAYTLTSSESCNGAYTSGFGYDDQTEAWVSDVAAATPDMSVSGGSCLFSHDLTNVQAAVVGAAVGHGYAVARWVPNAASDAMGIEFGRYSASTFYRVRYSSGVWVLDRSYGGSIVTYNLGSGSIAAGVPFWLQVEIEGGAISVSVWNDGVGQPSTPQYAFYDASPLAGQWGVYGEAGVAAAHLPFTSFRVYASSTPAATATPGAAATSTPYYLSQLTPTVTSPNPLCPDPAPPNDPDCTPTPAPDRSNSGGEYGGGNGDPCGMMPNVNFRNSVDLLKWEFCEVKNGDTTDAPVIGGVQQGLAAVWGEGQSMLWWLYDLSVGVGDVWSAVGSGFQGLGGQLTGLGSSIIGGLSNPINLVTGAVNLVTGAVNAAQAAIASAVSGGISGVVSQLTVWFVPSGSDLVPLQGIVRDLEHRSPFSIVISIGKVAVSVAGAFASAAGAPAVDSAALGSSLDNAGCGTLAVSSTPGAVPDVATGTPGVLVSLTPSVPACYSGAGGVGGLPPSVVATPAGSLQAPAIGSATLSPQMPAGFTANNPATYGVVSLGVQQVVNVMTWLGIPPGAIAKLGDFFIVLGVVMRCLNDIRGAKGGGDEVAK